MSQTSTKKEFNKESYKQIYIGPKSVLIPDDWDTAKLGDIAENGEKKFVDGDWVESKDMVSDGEYQLIQLGNIGEGYFKGECDKFVSEEFFHKKNCTLVESGDLLISRLADPVLRTIIVPEFERKSITAVDVVIAKVDETEWSKEYLWQLFNSKHLSDAGNSLATGSTRQRISRTNMSKITIPRPTLSEQRQIANILLTVDKEIQQTDEIIRLTTELKSEVANTLFVSGVGKKETQLVKLGPKFVNIPCEWEIKKLTNIKSPETNAVQTGPYQLGDVEFKNSGLRVYGQSNVTSDNYDSVSNYISPELEDDFLRYKIQPRDVLLTRMGTVGDASLFPDDADLGILSYHLLRIRPDQNECWSPYLHHLLNDGKIIMDQISSLSHGTIMDGLNVSTLRQVKIPLPPLSEQKSIAEVLDKFDEKISHEREHKTKLEELKNGLMQDLLTGKVRVNTTNQ